MSAPSRDSFPRFAELPRTLAPLGYRNFALFLIGHSTSHTGRWIELTGTVWLVYELTGSPILLGLLGIARAVPAVILSPIAGVVADRVDQRRLLFTTQGMSLFASLGLGVLIATGHVQLWHVYIQVGIQSAITAFDAVVRQALFPRLVPRAQLASAVTLSATASRLSELVGPPLGGLAIAGLGMAAPFLLNAGTFLGLMAAVAWMRGVVPRTAMVGSSLRGELTDGVRHMMSSPELSGLLKLEIAFGVFQLNPVMITIVGRQVIGVGPAGLGGLLSAPALGAFCGVLILIFVGQSRRQGRFVVICSFAYAAALLAFAASREFAVSFAVLVVVGLFDTLVSVTRQSITQLISPGRMRGRVMANMRTVTAGVSPLSQTQSGALTEAIGTSLAVVSAAVALAVAAGAIAHMNPALWGLERQVTPRDSLSPASAGSPRVLPPP
jgi:MFS family permease